MAVADPNNPPESAPARIAVVGAGGIGGYFAGALARAGHQVHLLARGRHLNAIRQQNGLTVREPDGTTFVAPVQATDDPRGLVGAAFVIVAVKSYSLAEVASTVKALATGEGTDDGPRKGAVVVPLLNGVDVVDRLVELGVPRAALLAGIAYISAFRVAPGVVARFSNFRRIVVGEDTGPVSERARQFTAACLKADIEAKASETIRLDLWRKFMFLAPMAAVCGLARRPIGAVRQAPFGPSVIERAVREVADVGRASGVPLSDDDVAHALRALEALPAGTKPSFLADLEQGGQNELDALSGTVARLGLTLRVETPIHATVVAAVSAAAAEPSGSA